MRARLSPRGISARTSLRTKLVTAVLALVIMALVSSSVASVYMLRSSLPTQDDSQLASYFTFYYNLPGYGLNGGSAGVAYSIRGASNYIIALQPTGTQLNLGNIGNSGPTRSPSGTQSLPELPTSQSWATSKSPETLTVSAQSGTQTWRVIAQTIQYQVEDSSGATHTETGTLIVAVPLGPVNQTIKRIAAFDIAVSAAIVLVLTVVGFAVVRANLRPLEEIEETAGEIATGHLNRRVPERDPNTEVGSLGRSLNIMLSQIETAFRAQQESESAAHASEERMRRFVADASHELRTPLTAIRGYAEYYRQRGGVTDPLVNGSGENLSREDLDRMMQRVEAEASRMGLLVEDLLLLARLDQQRPLDIKPVDILTLAADAVQDARMIAPDRPIDLEIAPGMAFIVNGDEPRLRQVIGNLMTNALTHTPPGTPVRVRIGSGALDNGQPALVLDVSDRGPGLTPEQAQRVFERFYRADAARTRVAGGSGLGLAIVASLIAAHGGNVSVHSAPGQGATFRVRLPLVAEAQSSRYDDEESQQYS